MSQDANPSSPGTRPPAAPPRADGVLDAHVEAAHEHAIFCSLPVLAMGVAAANLIAVRVAFQFLQGDELLTLVSIATALFAFGLGSLFPAGLFGTARAREAGYLFFFWLAAMAAPAGIVGAHVLAPSFLGHTRCLTPVQAFLLAGLAAAPMNLTAGCAMAFAFSREVQPAGTNRNKYAFLLIGLTFGCGLLTWLIADHFPPVPTDLCISILLLTTAAVLGYRFGSASLVLSPLIWISFLVVITVSCSPICKMLNAYAEEQMYGSDFPDIVTGPTGVVTVSREGKEALIALNRCPMVYRGHVRRPGEIIETVHIPLLLHPEPRRVLLLGGSGPDIFEEILRQPVELVECLMPDETVQSQFIQSIDLGLMITQALKEGKLVIQGGESDVRTALKNPNTAYDVVLVDLPPPSNAAFNRFYTGEFLSDLKALLKPGGLVAVRCSRPSRAAAVQRTVAFASFLRTFGHTFPGYILAGRETTVCIGSVSPEPLPTDPAIVERKRAERELAINLGGETRPDLPLLRKGLPPNDPEFAGVPMDRELRPITGLCSAVGWLTTMPRGVRTKAMVLLKVDMETLVMILVGVAFVVAIVAILVRRRGSLGAMFGLCVGQFIAGAFLAVLLFGDQCLFGTLFRDVGALATAFFLGGTAAAIIALGRRSQWVAGNFIVGGLLLLLGTVAALTPGILELAVNTSSASMRLLHLYITLPLLSAFAGSAAGGLVPAAVAVLGAGRSQEQAACVSPTRRAERVALAVGAMAGAAGLKVGAVLLLPVIGLSGACYFCALFASAGVIVLVFARGE